MRYPGLDRGQAIPDLPIINAFRPTKNNLRIPVQYATPKGPLRAMTHVPAAPGDNIRVPPIQATCRLPKLDPRRSDQDRLPTNWVDVPILNTAQRPRPNPRTYDYRVGRSGLSRAERAVDDLLDVLHQRADKHPATGYKSLV